MLINAEKVNLADLRTEKLRKAFFTDDKNWKTCNNSKIFFWKFDLMEVEGYGTFFRYSKRCRHPQYNHDLGKMEDVVSCNVNEYYFIGWDKELEAIDFTASLSHMLIDFKEIYIKELTKESAA